VVIFLTGTRSVVVALFAAALVFSLSVFHNASRVFRYALLGFWIALLVCSGVFFATRHNAFWVHVPVFSRLAAEGFQANARLMAWQAGFEAFKERPIFGWGLENFYAAFNQHYNPSLLRYGFNETFFDKPHNVFIQFLVETGVVGFLMYVIVFGIALWRVRRRPWLTALIAAYLAQIFFAFDTISSLIMMIAVLAFIDAMGSAGDGFKNRYNDAGYSTPHLTLSVTAAFICALTLVYFVNYRVWRASHLEWRSINYFVQNYIPEGLDYFNQALAAPTPYHQYIQKDLYPNIGLLYKQNIAFTDARTLVAQAVAGMEEAIRREPLHYGFLIGFADMMTYVADLNPLYLDKGEEMVRRADVLSPRRQSTQYVLAKIRNLKGDKLGAIAAMKTAIDFDPEVGDAHFLYGLLLLDNGQITKGLAEIHVARGLGRIPKNADESTIIAAHVGEAGLYKESQEYYNMVLLFRSYDNEARVKLGLVYYFDKQYDKARQFISEVMKTEDLKKSPQYPALQPILRELGLEK